MTEVHLRAEEAEDGEKGERNESKQREEESGASQISDSEQIDHHAYTDVGYTHSPC